MRAIGLLLSFLIAHVLAGTPPVRAEDASAPPGYVEAVDRGMRELDLRNYAEAREEFRRAHELQPSARTFRALGFVEFELRNYGECAGFLEQALASKVKPLEPKMRRDVEDLLTRARRYLGELHLEVRPKQASVIVDGVVMQLGDQASLVLEVGEHTVEVQADGHVSERRVIQVKGGQRSDLHVVLGPLASSSSLPRVSLSEGGRKDWGEPARRPTRLYKNPWLWTGVAVLAAGAAVAIFYATRAEPAARLERGDPGIGGGVVQTLQARP
ncbi:MAG: hypothetical protein JWN48_6037 [Myxococcaceae bacterium]|nr:hypothetical protein [Myxococcaceae bacterium]